MSDEARQKLFKSSSFGNLYKTLEGLNQEDKNDVMESYYALKAEYDEDGMERI